MQQCHVTIHHFLCRPHLRLVARGWASGHELEHGERGLSTIRHDENTRVQLSTTLRPRLPILEYARPRGRTEDGEANK